MFKNYLLSIIRNLKRDRLYSLINLAGLSIGLSCFLFIAIFVYQESRYGAFHRDADRLYRVITEMNNEEGATLTVDELLAAGFRLPHSGRMVDDRHGRRRCAVDRLPDGKLSGRTGSGGESDTLAEG